MLNIYDAFTREKQTCWRRKQSQNSDSSVRLRGCLHKVVGCIYTVYFNMSTIFNEKLVSCISSTLIRRSFDFRCFNSLYVFNFHNVNMHAKFENFFSECWLWLCDFIYLFITESLSHVWGKTFLFFTLQAVTVDTLSWVLWFFAQNEWPNHQKQAKNIIVVKRSAHNM